MIKSIGKKPQQGVSLVEIMVSLAIGVLLMAGVVQIMTSTKNTFRVQEGLARIQENARFGKSVVARMVRLAGYRTDPAEVLQLAFTPDSTINQPVPITFRAGQVIAGTDNNAGNGDEVLDGTDTLTVRYQGAEDNSTRNCVGASIPFGQMGIDTFYVNDAEPFALMCRWVIRQGATVLATQAQPLVDGVEQFKVIYGLDVDNDPTLPVANCYLDASVEATSPVLGCATGVNFDQVVAIRFGVLFHTSGDNGINLTKEHDTHTYDVLGPEIQMAASDTSEHRLRRVFASVASLRNKLK